MSTEDAKAYLAVREVPRLFECLMTGLMFHRPNDHIQYLIDSLEKVKVKGQAAVTWNMFVDAHSAKTPLPPIAPDNGKRPLSRGHSKEDAKLVTSARTTPLPPIASDNPTNVPVIFIMGGPCSGKSDHANRLAKHHQGWANIHLGELLRTQIHNDDTHDKWKTVKDMVVSGELAPEDVTLNLLQNCLKKNTQANGFIIHGFPRNMEQAQLFDKSVGHVDAVLLIDCGEDNLMKNASLRAQKCERLDETPSAFAKRMFVFKEQTLPVLKYYDDGGKLYIVDGDQDDETIQDELSVLFETLLQRMENGRLPTPPPESRPSTGRWSRKKISSPTAPPLSPPPSPEDSKLTLKIPSFTFVPPPEIKVKDEGRKPELPSAPIIFLAGGPGSGKGTQCQKITARYPDIVHLSMGDILRTEITERGTADDKWLMVMKLLKQGDMAPVDVTEELLIRSLKEQPDAQAYLVEGYPRDALQYEEFNRNIGGHAFTILLDCDSQYLHDRLVLRGGSGNDRIDDNIPAIENKLAFFARNTIPLLKAIEDEEKLIVIDGDRDEEEVFYDIVKCLDFSLYGLKLQEGKTSSGDNVKSDDDDEEDGNEEQQVEEEFIATTSTTTGGGGGNPDFSAMLDALDDPIVMIEIDAENEFAMEDEQKDETLQENNDNETNNLENEDKQVDLLTNHEEVGGLENGAGEDVEQPNEEAVGNLSHAVNDGRDIDEATHNTAEEVGSEETHAKEDVEQLNEEAEGNLSHAVNNRDVDETSNETAEEAFSAENSAREAQPTEKTEENVSHAVNDQDVEEANNHTDKDDEVNKKEDDQNGNQKTTEDDQQEEDSLVTEKVAGAETEEDVEKAADDEGEEETEEN